MRCILCCQSAPQILNSLAQLTLPMEGFLQSGVPIPQTLNLTQLPITQNFMAFKGLPSTPSYSTLTA